MSNSTNTTTKCKITKFKINLDCCPRCGNKAVLKLNLGKGNNKYCVICNECGTRTHSFKRYYDAVEVWNRRLDNYLYK